MKADRARVRVSIVVLTSVCILTAARAQAPDYARAERFLGWNVYPLVTGDEVTPRWLWGSDRFWYRNKIADGHEFVLVDPMRNTRARAFDHGRLASALSSATDSSYAAAKLPFNRFEFVDEAEGAIQFDISGRGFRCDLQSYVCTPVDAPRPRHAYVNSPDRRWEAFIYDYNVYVRPAGGGDSIPLTRDGKQYWAYGITDPRPRTILSGEPVRPILQWSPDSRKIAVQRTDERDVLHVPLYSSTTQRPRLWTYPYALPGDSVIPRFAIYIMDIVDRRSTRIVVDPHPYPIAGVTGMHDSLWVTVKWSSDSQHLYFTHASRGSKRIQLMVSDLSGRRPRLLAKDTASTWVELKHGGRMPPNWAVANGGEDVIWFSQRDGWAHLYRFGPDGELKNQITSGNFAVEEIKHVDERRSVIYFTAWGAVADENPYHRHLFRVRFDGTTLERLTPEEGDHQVTFTPSGSFFLDSYSTVTTPPVTVLRAAPDGRVVRTLEKADISMLLENGWRFPEVFKVKARDGMTDLYGLMFKPSDFDPSRSYPVIDHIYPGPLVGSVRNWGFAASRGHDPQAIAELGFIVIQLDHMGTPWRSKAFHDFYYGNIAENGLPDHVAALKQLAARHGFIDLDRVGIHGHSGGAFAATHAILRYPDFFKVAVATSGNHDNRSYGFSWGEKYQGLLLRDDVTRRDNYENQVNYLLANNLKGKLFLMHGDMDDNVHPATTLQVANALIQANKDFDLLILPDRQHGTFRGLNEPYVIRRRWDYFVRHLLGLEPPVDYEIMDPKNEPLSE